jgi:hypothetical protein
MNLQLLVFDFHMNGINIFFFLLMPSTIFTGGNLYRGIFVLGGGVKCDLHNLVCFSLRSCLTVCFGINCRYISVVNHRRHRWCYYSCHLLRTLVPDWLHSKPLRSMLCYHLQLCCFALYFGLGQLHSFALWHFYWQLRIQSDDMKEVQTVAMCRNIDSLNIPRRRCSQWDCCHVFRCF